MNIPTLHLALPRTLTAIHQIEISSTCGLRCTYCCSPKIKRGEYEKWGRKWQCIDRETYVRSLQWVRHYVQAGTQKYLNLAGTGESTDHPEFLAFVRLAREAVGPDVGLIFATNGLNHDEEMILELAQYKPSVWVSLHRPEIAGKAIEIYRKYGLLFGVSADPSINANDWAGQVEWHNTGGNTMACQWIREGKAYVLSDGRLAACCLSQGQPDSIIGHVNDEIDSVRLAPYGLCRHCHQHVGVHGYDQWEGRTPPGMDLHQIGSK